MMGGMKIWWGRSLLRGFILVKGISKFLVASGDSPHSINRENTVKFAHIITNFCVGLEQTYLKV